MSARFDGTIALITGATSGIGKATALSLAAGGAHVLVVGRDPARGEAVVAAIRDGGGTAHYLPADLRTADSARLLARQAVQTGGGRVDILVNNAGIAPVGPTADMTEAEIDIALAVNVKVPFVLVGEIAPGMAERGKGAIVNVGTMVAEFGLAGMAIYGASKAALNLLTKAWAAEFGPRGVRVNSVNPGPTHTEGTARISAMQDQLAAHAPAGRAASAGEIASAIAYLASDDASYVNGAVVPVDGGRTAS